MLTVLYDEYLETTRCPGQPHRVYAKKLTYREMRLYSAAAAAAAVGDAAWLGRSVLIGAYKLFCGRVMLRV
jgi:hypothetical protein